MAINRGASARTLWRRDFANGLQMAHGSLWRPGWMGNIEIFTVDVADGRLTRLTNSPGDDRDPTWSPDGSQIAFSSVRDGNTEIYVMRADGTGLRRVTNDPAEDVSPAWSPDGSTIAFASGVGEDRDLFVIRLEIGRASCRERV